LVSDWLRLSQVYIYINWRILHWSSAEVVVVMRVEGHPIRECYTYSFI